MLLMFGIGLLVVIAGGAALGGLKSWGQPAAALGSTPAGRNDIRKTQLKLMAAALVRYTAEVGKVPVAIPNHQVGICSGVTAACKTAGMIDLTFLISRGDITSLPSDPVGGHERYSTGYTIGRDVGGQLTLAAPRAENGAVITQAVK